jgi:hypothetical protein
VVSTSSRHPTDLSKFQKLQEAVSELTNLTAAGLIVQMLLGFKASVCSIRESPAPTLRSTTFWTPAGPGQLGVSFLLGETSPNFDLNKYDFDLYKGFFMAKMAQILQISKKSK